MHCTPGHHWRLKDREVTHSKLRYTYIINFWQTGGFIKVKEIDSSVSSICLCNVLTDTTFITTVTTFFIYIYIYNFVKILDNNKIKCSLLFPETKLFL